MQFRSRSGISIRCQFASFEGAEVFLTTVYLNSGKPAVCSSDRVNTLETAKSVALNAAIAAVLAVGRQSQIGNSVVVLLPVYVVNATSRPFSERQQPRDTMRGIAFARE